MLTTFCLALLTSQDDDSCSNSFLYTIQYVYIEIIETLENEWTRHNVVKRTFSPLGFQKGRLPNDVFASMGAFYYNNRHHKVFEEWGDRGVFVNWYESSCCKCQL